MPGSASSAPGSLVEVASIDTLRQMHATSLDIDVEGVPPDLSSVAGVDRSERTPNGLRVHLTGSPQPVLDALVGTKVTALRSEEASLEEIFLTYYGETYDGETDAASDGGDHVAP